MTTIAFDGTMVAADGLICLGDQVVGRSTKKLHVVAPGAYAGYAGADPIGKKRIQWLREGGKPEAWPTIEGQDCSLLVVYDDGSAALVCDGVMTEVAAPFAIGSGAQFAIGAMHAGCNAFEAVEIAAKCDAFTGGRIDSYLVVKPNTMSAEEIEAERPAFIAALDDLHDAAKDLLSLSAIARKEVG